ncbi:MAG: transcriptional regulator [Candidatus Diapherotrites archaeon CG08_land_8_20_14_0_20_34_12]|nr:MAG: transcriptional regulator [Candidatus Diapherotrites archaeon CG08_land_8_20_14_0_20_34_12]
MLEKLPSTIAGEISLSRDPGGSIKKWREIFNITQTDLAKELKISPSTISDYEGGRRKNPGINVVSRFVNTIIEIDGKRGGKIIKQLEKDFEPSFDTFEIHEFLKSVKGTDFMQMINGICLANESKLQETNIYGYTIIDSLKVIIKVPVHEYMHLYGKTPERALIFEQVETGRSPLIAVKISKFSTNMNPAIIVLHTPKKPEEIDAVAIKIAESEKIPLLITAKPLADIAKDLQKFET